MSTDGNAEVTPALSGYWLAVATASALEAALNTDKPSVPFAVSVADYGWDGDYMFAIKQGRLMDYHSLSAALLQNGLPIPGTLTAIKTQIKAKFADWHDTPAGALQWAVNEVLK